MKATIEVPDELYRRVKAMSAMQGRAIREVTVELYRKWLDEGSAAPAPQSGQWPERVMEHPVLADLPGLVRREILEEGRNRLVGNEEAVSKAPSLHDRFRKYCGVVKSGVGDLSTNPKHMEGFGDD